MPWILKSRVQKIASDMRAYIRERFLIGDPLANCRADIACMKTENRELSRTIGQLNDSLSVMSRSLKAAWDQADGLTKERNNALDRLAVLFAANEKLQEEFDKLKMASEIEIAKLKNASENYDELSGMCRDMVEHYNHVYVGQKKGSVGGLLALAIRAIADHLMMNEEIDPELEVEDFDDDEDEKECGLCGAKGVPLTDIDGYWRCSECDELEDDDAEDED